MNNSGSHGHAPKIAVIVPTWNASRLATPLIDALAEQSLQPDRCIVIDSESKDSTREMFEAAGWEVTTVRQKDFDHGGTRNIGITLAAEADILVYLTQDAVPHGKHCLANLMQAFHDPRTGIAYGRQLPRDGATPIEAHARQFNYPAISSTRTSASAVPMGIKGIFNSNSFAAYRKAALEEVGSFPTRVIMGEDQVAAARMLEGGYSISYVAEAEVIHSHSYTLLEEFRRYFDIGVFHESNRSLFQEFGTASSEGQRFVASEIRHLLRRSPARIPEAFLRSALKLLAYRLGRHEAVLPRIVAAQFAMHKQFFRTARPESEAAVPVRTS